MLNIRNRRTKNFASGFHPKSATADSDRYCNIIYLFIYLSIYLSSYLHVKDIAPVKYLIYSSYLYKSLKYNFKAICSHITLRDEAGSLKMNTALEYSTRVVQEGGRRCKKSTLNDLVHLTPLRIPLMNPPMVWANCKSV
jgi:hypothetical protein